MHVGVIGIGGVGGYFGGKLCSLLDQTNWPDLKIYFVARNRHLEAIKQNGLILSMADEGEITCRPTLATDDIGELPELELCLLCVKSYDLEGVLVSIKDRIKPETVILPLLNGVDIAERIRTVIPWGTVYPACVYVGTHIESYGRVVQNGGSCTIFFGTDPAHPEANLRTIIDLFDAARIKYRYCDDPYKEIWSKYIFIAAYGMVSASEDKTLGQIIESHALRELTGGIMNEIMQIARRQGVDLPEEIVAQSLDKAGNFPYETKTSFQRDFQQMDKYDERDLYGDTIIRLGEQAGVQTPYTCLVKNKLELKKKITV